MTAPAPQTLDQLSQDNPQLIRKFTRAVLFVGAASVALPATLTTGASGDLAVLPTGMKPVGVVRKKEGFKFANKQTTDEVESFGYVAPTLRNISKEDTSFNFTAQQSSKHVMSMFHGLDLAAVTADATSGEVSFAKPTSPDVINYRAILIARDGRGSSAQYYGVLYPQAQVSETGDQSITPDEEFAYPMTLAATPDATAGFAVKYFWGGPGFKAQGVANGFAVS